MSSALKRTAEWCGHGLHWWEWWQAPGDVTSLELCDLLRSYYLNPLSPRDLADIIGLVEEGVITRAGGQEVMETMIRERQQAFRQRVIAMGLPVED